jgi:hypothetical protein
MFGMPHEVRMARLRRFVAARLPRHLTQRGDRREVILFAPADGQQVTAPQQQSSQALGPFHKAEIEHWWPIIKAANIKLE